MSAARIGDAGNDVAKAFKELIRQIKSIRPAEIGLGRALVVVSELSGVSDSIVGWLKSRDVDNGVDAEQGRVIAKAVIAYIIRTNPIDLVSQSASLDAWIEGLVFSISGDAGLHGDVVRMMVGSASGARLARIEKKVASLQAQLEIDRDLKNKIQTLSAAVDEIDMRLREKSEAIEAASSGFKEAEKNAIIAKQEADQHLAQARAKIEDLNQFGIAGAFAKRANLLGRRQVVSEAIFVVLAVAIAVSLVYGVDLAPAKGEEFNWYRLIPKVVAGSLMFWLGWLLVRTATISARVGEDYAFKAAMAQSLKAYESEAGDDDELRKALIDSVLKSFGENPSRLYPNSNSPGHPFEDAVGKSMELALKVTKGKGAG